MFVCTRKPEMPPSQKDALLLSSTWCYFLGAEYLDRGYIAQVLKMSLLCCFTRKPWVNSSDYGSDSFSASIRVPSRETEFPLVKSHLMYFRLIY